MLAMLHYDAEFSDFTGLLFSINKLVLTTKFVCSKPPQLFVVFFSFTNVFHFNTPTIISLEFQKQRVIFDKHNMIKSITLPKSAYISPHSLLRRIP